MRFGLTLVLALSILTLAPSCGDKGGGQSGGSSSGSSKGLVSVKLRSSTLSLAPTSSDSLASTSSSVRPMAACSLYLGSGVGTHNGDCIDARRFVAKAAKLSIGSSQGGVPARLIDMAAAPDGTGFEGPFGVLGLASFDFSVAAAVSNQYSDDNVQDTSTLVFDQVSVSTGALEIQIEIPAGNGSVANKFWTIRYPFVAQNPMQDPAFTSCPTDATVRTKIQNDGDLYSAPANFQRGDILVCRKANQADVCADSDFQWINSADGSTSGTRPASPVRLTGAHAMFSPTCADGTPPELAWGESAIRAWIADGAGFKLKKESQWSTTEGGDKQWDGYLYTFTSGCADSGVCAGAPITGDRITAEVNFDLSGAVFVHDSVDLDSHTEAAILQNLQKILPKPLYVSNNQLNEGDGLDPGLTATVSITATPTP